MKFKHTLEEKTNTSYSPNSNSYTECFRRRSLLPHIHKLLILIEMMGDSENRGIKRPRPSSVSEMKRDRSDDRMRNSMKSSNCRVYVSNIPYEFRWQELKDIFRNEVGDVQFVELFVDESNKSKGTGIVEFSVPQLVPKCIEVMHGYEIKTRKLVVKEDTGNMRDKHGRIVNSTGRRGRDDRFTGPQHNILPPSEELCDTNTYGLSLSFLNSLRIDLPLCNRVFVANLDYTVDKKKLKEVFRLAGKVQKVEMHFDKEGRSRGFAVIEYDHPVEAVQAISMLDNQLLYERHMTVKMDRASTQYKLPEGLKGVGMGLGSNGEPLKDIPRNLPSGGQSNGSTPVGNPAALQVASALSGLIGNGLAPDQNKLVQALSGGSFVGRSENEPFTSNIAPFGGPIGSPNKLATLGKTGGRYSNKVLITNIPNNCNFKMMQDKFRSFGEVLHIEEKGNGSVLIIYSSDWQAERAIKNLDRSRVDGRMIEARSYY